jgi:hypothetical protein
MKTFIHPDLLRTVNFGNNSEAADGFFTRIDRETEEVEGLRKRGFSTHEAWVLVRMQRGLVN